MVYVQYKSIIYDYVVSFFQLTMTILYYFAYSHARITLFSHIVCSCRALNSRDSTWKLVKLPLGCTVDKSSLISCTVSELKCYLQGTVKTQYNTHFYQRPFTWKLNYASSISSFVAQITFSIWLSHNGRLECLNKIISS